MHTKSIIYGFFLMDNIYFWSILHSSSHLFLLSGNRISRLSIYGSITNQTADQRRCEYQQSNVSSDVKLTCTSPVMAQLVIEQCRQLMSQRDIESIKNIHSIYINVHIVNIFYISLRAILKHNKYLKVPDH